jgi:intein-encoded DNA endonuclease-like protein
MLRLEENKNKIIEMYMSGISTNQISLKFKCSSASIYLKLKKWNINIKKKQKFIGNINDYKKEIIEMYNNGIGSYLISKKLNISKSSISRFIKKIQLSRKSKVDRDNLLKNKKDLIIELFKQYNISEISKIVNHSQSNIIKILKESNIDTSKYKYKYRINEKYFEKIDTPEKAYILGWIYSDGNVTKNGKIRISIQDTDVDILNDIKREIGYDGKILFTQSKNKNHKSLVTLNIDRIKMVEDLIKLGVIPNKSLILKFPLSNQVPDYLLNHFVRGVFDGDGSICMKNQKCRYVSITSTFDFCNSLSEYLKSINIYPTNFYLRKVGKSTGSLFFGRKKDILNFLKWIYKDSSIKLYRKYSKAKCFI